MVVGLFAGEKRSGGFELEITATEQKNSKLYIYYVERDPPPDGIVIQALTQPFHLIKVPRSDASVVFEKLIR